MSTIVIYKSDTGFTEKYGKWIGEALDCSTVKFNPKTGFDASEYDTVIFGGNVFGGTINGWDAFKNANCFEGKKVFLYACGATAMNQSEVIQRIKNTALTEEMQKSIEFYYFEGGINFEKMFFLFRWMLKLMAKGLAKKENATDEEIQMAEALGKSHDSTNKIYIQPLVDSVKKS
jgi:menaquinone-dependent protoporphyrinogen IX oxidase